MGLLESNVCSSKYTGVPPNVQQSNSKHIIFSSPVSSLCCNQKSHFNLIPGHPSAHQTYSKSHWTGEKCLGFFTHSFIKLHTLLPLFFTSLCVHICTYVYCCYKRKTAFANVRSLFCRCAILYINRERKKNRKE